MKKIVSAFYLLAVAGIICMSILMLSKNAAAEELIQKSFDAIAVPSLSEWGNNIANKDIEIEYSADGNFSDISAPADASFTADSGFRPEVNGFGFENYGKDKPYKNLTPAEMIRMFSDKVCASQADGNCILTPPAEQWMESVNKGMGGGHCEGMAVLSEVFFAYPEIKKADQFGTSNVTELKIEENEALQREIAYWFTTQALESVSSSIIKGTPAEIVTKLIESYTTAGSEKYAIGFYKRDMTGGHAVMPYAVADAGNGIFNIIIYDNNYPKEPKFIVVDSNQNTWKYTASINPAVPAEEYEGDANTKTLEIVPMSSRFKQPYEAPFLRAAQSRRSGDEPLYNEIRLFGDADLYISDNQGRNYGYVNGALVQDIPEVKMQSSKYGSYDKYNEPVYYVPVGMEFSITVDGYRVVKQCAVSLSMIGPGYYLEIEDIRIEPGQTDGILFSSDGTKITYLSDANESPDVSVGVETSEADYEFRLKAAETEFGVEFDILLDTEEGDFIFNTTENSGETRYEIVMARIDENGEQIFYHDDILMKPDDVAYFNHLEWTGNGAVSLDIDHGNDSNIDETIELADEDMTGDMDWVDISGKVTTEDGTPLCTMVLANGEHMFTCNPAGEYELSVPLDDSGRITLFAFCDGSSPFRQSLDPEEAENFDIIMTPAPADSRQMNVTWEFDTAGVEHPGWVKISGQALLQDSGEPLCSMILANGQHIFSCAGEGKYELEIPLDDKGEITLFGFTDGFQPFRKEGLKP